MQKEVDGGGVVVLLLRTMPSSAALPRTHTHTHTHIPFAKLPFPLQRICIQQVTSTMGAGSSMSIVDHNDMDDNLHPDIDTWEHEQANLHREEMDKVVDKSGAKERFTVSERLYDAAFNGNYVMVEDLIEKGANLEYASIQGGMTPLHIATMNDHEDVVKLLIEKGVCELSKILPNSRYINN